MTNYRIGTWVFAPADKQLTNDDAKTVKITDQQSAILLLLSKANGELVEQAYLEQEIWNNNVSDNTVKTAITNLRKCFDLDGISLIVNERGKGYRLQSVAPIFPGFSSTEMRDPLQYRNKILVFSFIVLLLGIFSWEVEQAFSDSNQFNLPRGEFQILTYELGDEYGPATHTDGKLLAYTASRGSIFDSSVIVKDKSTQQTVQFNQFEFSSSPFWAGNSLYYQVYQAGQCQIYRSEYHAGLNFEAAELITSCGTQLSVSPIAVDRYHEWLYFSYKASASSPFVLKRYNLRNQRIQQLTTDNDENFGAYSLALSPNADMVAYLNADAADQVHLRVLTIETLTSQPFGKQFGTIGSVAWLNDEEILIPSANKLLALNIHSRHTRTVREFDERVYGIEVTGGHSAILPYGDLYLSRLSQFDGETLRNLDEIGSQLGGVAQSDDEHGIFYLSNQTGKTEIWHYLNGDKTQLTKEERGRRIRQLRYNARTNSLYYVLDNELKILNLTSGQVKAFAELTLEIQNYTFSCDALSLLVTAKFNGVWTLYRFDPDSGLAPTVLRQDVYGIEADCQTGRYATTNQYDAKVAVFDDNFDAPTEVLVPPVALSDLQWRYFANGLYFIDRGELKVFNNGHLSTSLSPQQNNWFFNSFSVSGDQVNLTQKSKSNTYLIEIIGLNKS